jgi:hypothetical protein
MHAQIQHGPSVSHPQIWNRLIHRLVPLPSTAHWRIAKIELVAWLPHSCAVL